MPYEAPSPITEFPPVEGEQELSLGQLAGRAWRESRDALRSDEGIQASGLALGTLAGFGILRAVKGGEADQLAPQQNTLDQPKGSYPQHSETGTAHLAEAGIIAGPMILGVIGATIITRQRQRRGNRSE